MQAWILKDFEFLTVVLGLIRISTSFQRESFTRRHQPHLFIQNAKVDEFNQRVHNAATGNKFTINAQDSVIGATSPELRNKINS